MPQNFILCMTESCLNITMCLALFSLFLLGSTWLPVLGITVQRVLAIIDIIIIGEASYKLRRTSLQAGDSQWDNCGGKLSYCEN